MAESIHLESFFDENNIKQNWDALVEKYASSIYGYLHHYCKAHMNGLKEDDICDITQNVFLKLVKDDFRLLRRYDPKKGSFSTWLAVLTRSTALDYLRARARNHVPLEDYQDKLQAEEQGPRLQVNYPTGVLTERQQSVLHLLFEKDLDPAEVGRLMGVKTQTVRSIKHQALDRLRAHYGVTA
ncbi:RNA polymerase sigma factor [Salidesulfovibrio onnuriiensis]|uniref:RNA polymerase sigma factor n=1 Tax=Salidesulfovibrio onnuriiensis TaxID=2583823 RepID=UPI0011CBF98C|nr:sigma-70 family RNA polymerase sigma factor [Salidesulfovibrio onnuriiensis]